MATVKTFTSTDEPLSDLLQSIKAGKTQLPDFQRGWVWDDEHIRSLLASISLSYPIGAVMLLGAGGADVRFQCRPIEGAPRQNNAPERLILDGQQRLTSLYQALFSGKPVETKDARGKPIKRWYYLDIKKALDPKTDRKDAIIGLPEERQIRSFRGELTADYSTPQLERESALLPLPLVFDTSELNSWMMQYLQADPTTMAKRLETWNELTQRVLQQFQQYRVPLIVLEKETPKEAVCQVFEKVNTGGVSLTVFELLTATFAADGFHLRNDWATRERRLRRLRSLRAVQNTDFLQAVTLLATRKRRLQDMEGGKTADQASGISCKRRDVLRLTLGEYKEWADPVTDGFERAGKLLHGQKIFDARDVPYTGQLVPLAAALTVLGSKGDHAGVKEKLIRWYWCGVLGELYGAAVESRFAKDLPELLTWTNSGEEPDTVKEATFHPDRLLTLRTRNSAAYKGLYALLIRDGCLDFRTGVPIDEAAYFDEKIDIHHIFPQAWCSKAGLDRRRYDCIVNKTPLDAKTNRIIGGAAPSSYVPRIGRQAGLTDSQLDQIIASHVIDSTALRRDDFQTFFSQREGALLRRIESAMGKPVVRGVVAVDELGAEPLDSEEEDEAA